VIATKSTQKQKLYQVADDRFWYCLF